MVIVYIAKPMLCHYPECYHCLFESLHFCQRQPNWYVGYFNSTQGCCCFQKGSHAILMQCYHCLLKRQQISVRDVKCIKNCLFQIEKYKSQDWESLSSAFKFLSSRRLRKHSFSSPSSWLARRLATREVPGSNPG